MTDPRRPTFELAEARLGESLNAFLVARRKAGTPFRRIASELYQRTQVDVTAETVRQWCRAAEAAALPEPPMKPRTTRKPKGTS